MNPQTESEFKIALLSHPFSRIPFDGKMLDIKDLFYGEDPELDNIYSTIVQRVGYFVEELYLNGYRCFVIAGLSRGLNNIIATTLHGLVLHEKYNIVIFHVERYDERNDIASYSNDKIFFTPARQVAKGTDKTQELLRLLDKKRVKQ